MTTPEHVMTYVAGIGEFRGAQLTEPRWECQCGRWRYAAQAMPRRKTGNNKLEAERSFAAHIAAASASTLPDETEVSA